MRHIVCCKILGAVSALPSDCACRYHVALLDEGLMALFATVKITTPTSSCGWVSDSEVKESAPDMH